MTITSAEQIFPTFPRCLVILILAGLKLEWVVFRILFTVNLCTSFWHWNKNRSEVTM